MKGLAESSPLLRQQTTPIAFVWRNVVHALSPLFSVGSFPYLQGTTTYIRAQMSSKFSQIRPRAVELSALERLKKYL